MDDRSVEWLHLLPPNQCVVGDCPPALRHLLSPHIDADGKTYFGWREESSRLGQLDAYESLALLDPRGIRPKALQDRGFPQVLRFAVLPSIADARWFVPLATRQVAAAGLDFLPGYRPLTRLKKTLLSRAAMAGQLHRIGSVLTLALRARSPLQVLLEQVTGSSEVHLCLSTGAPSLKRKSTILILGGDGRVVAFAKLATSPAAKEAVQREALSLRALSKHATLDGSVPRVIAESEISDAAVNVVTPGPRGAGPSAFGEPHRQFLALLAEATGRQMRFEGSPMWERMQASRPDSASRLPTDWDGRIAVVFRRLCDRLGPRELTMSMAHRDFGPWNTRQHRDGRLFVLDWEGSQFGMIPLYDFFNFHFLGHASSTRSPAQVYRHVLESCRTWHPEMDEDLVPYLFMAYLVDHAIRRFTNSSDPSSGRDGLVLRTAAALLDSIAGSQLGS